MRGSAVIAIVGVALAGCSGDSDSDSERATDVSSVTATTALVTDAVAPVDDSTPAATVDDPLSGPGTAEACPAGELPSVGAFDLDTGAVLWSGCSAVTAYRDVIGASREVVVLMESSPEGQHLVAFDAADGTELWRHPVFPQLGIPVGSVDDDVVVIESASETPPFVMGVDPRTGEEIWRVASGTSVIAADQEIVVTANASRTEPRSGGGVVGLDRATGEELWSNPATFQYDAGSMTGRAAGAIADGVVAVPTGGSTTGIDLASGATRWTGDALDDPVGADGVFLGGTRTDGPPTHVQAISSSDGTTPWTAPGRSSYGGAIAAGDGVTVVLDSTSGGYVAYELATGQDRWRVDGSQLPFRVEPQLIAGTSLVLLWEAVVEVASTTDGSTTWISSQPLNSPWMNSVGANDTTVFVAVNSVPFSD